MRRPLIELSILMWAIIVAVSVINIYILRIVGGFLLVLNLVSFMACFKKQNDLDKVGLYICILVVAVLFIEFVHIQFLSVEADETINGRYEVSGLVKDVGLYTTIMSDVKVYDHEDTVEGAGKKRRLVRRVPKILVRHKWGKDPAWTVGDEIHVYGHISKFEEARNPGTFSPRKYYNSQRIPLVLKLDKSISVDEAKVSLLSLVAELREKLFYRVDQYLDSDEGSLLKGILLGDDRGIDERTLESFRVTGTAHILAVSGLHFGILYMFILRFLSKLRCPYKLSVTLSVVIMLFFVLLSGASFSAIRAFSMICLHVFSILTKRKYDILNALGVVALLSMSISPFLVWNVGFQLSYWAVFSIGAYMKLSQHLQRYGTFKSLDLLVFPIFIQCMLTPLMVYHFNRLNVYGIFFNVPTAVLMPFVLIGGILFLLFASLPLVGDLFVLMCQSFLASLRALTAIVWKLPFNTLVLGSPSAPLVGMFFLIFACMILSFRFRGWLLDHKFQIVRNGLLGLIVSVVLTSLPTNGLPINRNLKVDFLDVGQGDAILIHGNDGQKILIDSGPDKADLLDILLKQGITKLDAVFLSHPDADHISGFENIAGAISIETFYYGALTEKKDVLDHIKVLYPDTKFIQLKKGDRLKMGDVDFTVLHPPQIDLKAPKGSWKIRRMGANNMSLALVMEYKKRKILFTGDIEKESEHEILSHWKTKGEGLDVDILKVGHHGSKTSSSMSFIKAVQPEYAIIQVGRNNFGHPAPTTLNTLQRCGGIKDKSSIYRNDKQGCIRVFLGDEIHIIPWLTYHRQTWYNR